MIERACIRCGAAYTQRHPRHLHCSECEPHGKAHRSPSTRAQINGHRYRTARALVLGPGARCHWCGAPATTVDAIVPAARGGSHEPSNLRPACVPCNAAHGGRLAHGKDERRTHTPAPAAPGPVRLA